jgi:hypothetical protein
MKGTITALSFAKLLLLPLSSTGARGVMRVAGFRKRQHRFDRWFQFPGIDELCDLGQL